MSVEVQSNIVDRSEFNRSAFLGPYTTHDLLTLTTAWANALQNQQDSNFITITAFEDVSGGQIKSTSLEFGDIRTDSMTILEDGSNTVDIRKNGTALQVKKTGFTSEVKIRIVIHIN